MTRSDLDLHPQDAAALARLRERLKLTPGERWELWQASMNALEGWRGIARPTPKPGSAPQEPAVP